MAKKIFTVILFLAFGAAFVSDSYAQYEQKDKKPETIKESPKKPTPTPPPPKKP